MENRPGRVVLLGVVVLLSEVFLCQGAPLQYFHRSGESGGNAPSLSLFLPLVVSLSLLVVLTLLLVNCVTCCKEREINFKEFEDHFDDEIDFTPPAEDTPSTQSPVEVYTLAVPPVALPGPPHLQPPPPAQDGSAGSLLARHSLSYIQEIGNGLFGKVLLSEIYTDPGVTRVVVKELNANASAKEQNSFLQQGDPYRVLQHPNIMHCLGQCVEAIPFLLVFEYCEMGDLRAYVSQQDWMFRNAELLELQRMACEIAAGVTHLHKHNFLHSDLALRNCYLTVDLTVKVGDYGIGPHRYKEDYIVTEDDVFAPLRWLAPELVGERYGGVVSSEQTKPSNVWALGLTLWELFENGAQPYGHLSDREVLHHVIKEQQVKPFKPQLELPYADRWFEVLQFCWLPPDKRATAEEVHRLLTYLRMQGQKDMEEDFEQRWDALKPNLAARQQGPSADASSYPILEQFADDALRQEIDEVLTVTETSKGLSFEYVWEAAKQDHYESGGGGGGGRRPGLDATTLNYHSMFFPASTEDIQAHFPDPSGADPPGVRLPTFHAPKSVRGNEYFVRLGDQGESGDAGAAGTPGLDPNPARQEFVVLQDVLLEESSTDADFFHQSIDSKDSFLPDSHVWSSLENDSPYHQASLFAEGEEDPEARPQDDDSLSWRRSFMELPERSTNPFLDRAGPETPPGGCADGHAGSCSFLGVRPEPSGPTGPREGNWNGNPLMSRERLEENFLFLKENRLMTDGPPPQNLLAPGACHAPEESFKMSSWDHMADTWGLTAPEPHLGPPSPGQDSGSSLGEFCVSLAENEPALPSIVVVVSDEAAPPQPPPPPPTLQRRTSWSTEDLSPACSSTDTGIESGLAPEGRSTLELSLSDGVSLDALTPDLKEARGFWDDARGRGGVEGGGVGVLDVDQPQDFDTAFPDDGTGDSEALTGDDFLSELIDDAEAELQTVLSDHEESLTEDCNGPAAAARTSSLLVSAGPSLDQISQDSLLEDDSVSAALPTPDSSARTPDSLDSLEDLQRLDGPAEINGLATPPEKLRPPYKVADSGYETENLESPEWNSEPPGGDQSHVRNGFSAPQEGEGEGEGELQAAVALVPPEIIISEVENVAGVELQENQEIQKIQENRKIQDNRENQGNLENWENKEKQEEEVLPAGSVDAGVEPSSMAGSYRDSAYFSDNESDMEKKPEEGMVGAAAGGSGPAHPGWGPKAATAEVTGPPGGSSAEVMVEEYLSAISQHQGLLGDAVSGGQEMGETWSSGGPRDEADPQDHLRGSSAPHEPVSPASPTDEAGPLPPLEGAAHPKLTRTYASDGVRLKERDAEGRFLGRRQRGAAAGQEDAATDAADEEEEEEENSGEEEEEEEDSDEEARAYRLQGSSSESEDDAVHPVPVVVSDDTAARNLRSLLKTPAAAEGSAPCPASAATPPDGPRRAVTFFDDVTVYLFDQDTPTKELGDHVSGLTSSQVSEFSPGPVGGGYLNRFTNSESSTDEEGGGFEWDDDFSSSADSSFLSKASPASASSSSAASPGASSFSSPPSGAVRTPAPTWTPSPNYSRFSISPANIASFSLTHLTDSDMEQGGSSEDGEKD